MGANMSLGMIQGFGRNDLKKIARDIQNAVDLASTAVTVGVTGAPSLLPADATAGVLGGPVSTTTINHWGGITIQFNGVPVPTTPAAADETARLLIGALRARGVSHLMRITHFGTFEFSLPAAISSTKATIPMRWTANLIQIAGVNGGARCGTARRARRNPRACSKYC